MTKEGRLLRDKFKTAVAPSLDFGGVIVSGVELLHDNWRKGPLRLVWRRLRREIGEAMNDLPFWASVAFAARCGIVLAPMFDRVWPKAPVHVQRTFLRTLAHAEKAAAKGRPSRKLVALEKELFALLAMLYSYDAGGFDGILVGAFPEYEGLLDSLPHTEHGARLVREFMYVGVWVSRAAIARNTADAIDEAALGITSAFSVLVQVNAQEQFERLWALKNALYQLCEQEKATDLTTVRWSGSSWVLKNPTRAWWRLW